MVLPLEVLPLVHILTVLLGVDTGELPYQRGLAVIDVACGTDNHGAGSGNGAAARRFASAISSPDNALLALPRNRAASALPPGQRGDTVGTPAPRRCAAPSMV